jgi:protein-S-isoprenylcysteine O-methyltransferase Ste14
MLTEDEPAIRYVSPLLFVFASADWLALSVIVREGAYRRIRHLMYLGIIVAFLGSHLALDS